MLINPFASFYTEHLTSFIKVFCFYKIRVKRIRIS